MSTNEQIISAVAAWVNATVAGLKHVYQYAPMGKPHGLPDAVVELATEGPQLADEQFAIRVQQAGIYVWRLGISLMVSTGKTEADAAAAQQALYASGRALAESVMADETLGKRVQMASPWSFTADYTPPLVEYPDGTRGREATFAIAVAELVFEQ